MNIGTTDGQLNEADLTFINGYNITLENSLYNKQQVNELNLGLQTRIDNVEIDLKAYTDREISIQNSNLVLVQRQLVNTNKRLSTQTSRINSLTAETSDHYTVIASLVNNSVTKSKLNTVVLLFTLQEILLVAFILYFLHK